MKKILLLTITATILHSAFAQDFSSLASEQKKEANKHCSRLGLKVGYNVAVLSGTAPELSPNSIGGFNASAFYTSSSNGLGYRTELIFSRQGFSFDEQGSKNNVTHDYIYMPHLTTFTIANKLQLQAGGQIGYLLSAKRENETQKTESENFADLMNRIDFGAALGVEVYPFKGLIVGARYNVSVTNPYKDSPSSSNMPGNINPYPLPVNPADFNGKNAVLQLAVGYRF